MIEVPVLIVGGGPVGLTASILLSQQGIRSLLVERHPGTAIVPKARGINARTMEMYRQIGMEQAIRDAGLAPEGTGLIVWTESLAGREIERRVPGRLNPANRDVSPVLNCLCAQDDLEPVLRRFAEAQATAELRFNTEVTAVDQDAGGVSATLTDRLRGGETTVRAQYLIGADGAQSIVRRSVAREMIGREGVYDSVNIAFRADLRPWTQGRPAALYFVEQPDLRATFLTINAHDRWGFLIHSLKQYGYTASDFTRSALRRVDPAGRRQSRPAGRNAAVSASGKPLPSSPTVTATGGFSWPGMRRTRCRRPAASASTPACRTCTTWRGSSPPCCRAGRARRCSTAYEAERLPVATITTKASLENSLSMGRTARQDGAKLPRSEFLNEQGLIFGAIVSVDRHRPRRHAAAGGQRPGDAVPAVGAAGQPGAARAARTPRRAPVDHRPVRRPVRPADRGARRWLDRRRGAARVESATGAGCAHGGRRRGTRRPRRGMADPLRRCARGCGACPPRRVCRLAQPGWYRHPRSRAVAGARQHPRSSRSRRTPSASPSTCCRSWPS